MIGIIMGCCILVVFFYLIWLLYLKPLAVENVKKIFLDCSPELTKDDFARIYFEAGGNFFKTKNVAVDIARMVYESENPIEQSSKKIQQPSKKTKQWRAIEWLKKILRKKSRKD